MTKMSGDTIYEAPRKCTAATMRVHDYLYDSAYIVSGARDYARTAFRAGMASAQVIIQPIYNTMFSELRKCPRMHIVYHPNCRLPAHMDGSYRAYVKRVQKTVNTPTPDLDGKERFKYQAVPKQVLQVKTVVPEFHVTTPVTERGPSGPRNRGTQSIFRESSAQTHPWQPEGKAAATCENTPEVLYLDQLEWGPGTPYRTGDLPADFHTTEIINKLRHARKWTELAEAGQFPRWMKKQDGIIGDIETKDWIFREAEIDELQDIRLSLLHKLQSEQRQKKTTKMSKKLANIWACKKKDMERKIDHIRKTRDRELRKLAALHGGGGKPGQVARMRAACGGGAVTGAARDPASQMFAPPARFGHHAKHRHATILYDPTLLDLEDHRYVAEPPAWLEQCGHNLKRTCSGHHLPNDEKKLCERETKWSEQFLENLHNDLKKARLGAATTSAGPLRVLKPRRQVVTPRPPTPEVEGVADEDEGNHQAALVLQKILRGRAVQNLMFEGRTRAAELTKELKTTHGLQKEDRARIAKEETKAREYHVIRTEADQKEEAITALVEELCGGAVSAALDFLEKELRRLKEERRQHAFILIAMREKTMREAAEAGRRQKEEHRRREHDEIFKQVLGVTQDTVDAYLHEVIKEGVEMAAEEDAVKLALSRADKIDESLAEHGSICTAEQNEMVAELVQQFLLPEAHKAVSRQRLESVQSARLEAVRRSIFGTLDDARIKTDVCTLCGSLLDELCRCLVCKVHMEPVETSARDDPRWKYTRRVDTIEKTYEERYPPAHEIRYMLEDLVDDAVHKSREHHKIAEWIKWHLGQEVLEKTELTLEVREAAEEIVARATGEVALPIKEVDYHYFMYRQHEDALERSVPFDAHSKCPTDLPSEIRRREEEAAALSDPTCRCDERKGSRVKFGLSFMTEEDRMKLLPSELRDLEEMRRCKCDTSPSASQRSYASPYTVAFFDSTPDDITPEDEEEH